MPNIWQVVNHEYVVLRAQIYGIMRLTDANDIESLHLEWASRDCQAKSKTHSIAGILNSIWRNPLSLVVVRKMAGHL